VKKILVGLDFSELTDPTLETAATLARALDATVYLVHAVYYVPTIADVGAMTVIPPDPVAIHANAHDRLSAARDKLKAKGADASIIELETVGNPGYEVLEEAKRLGVDLIVIGSHGHGAMYQLLVGSTAELLIRKSPCPVVLVPPPQRLQTNEALPQSGERTS
jgi:nucleotide-binding universal stress UspA family protein